MAGITGRSTRYYDPKTGRWISQDPAGFRAGDANLYRYISNRATAAADPSGLVVRFVDLPTKKNHCRMTLWLDISFFSFDITFWGVFGSPLGIYGTYLANMAAWGSRAKRVIEGAWTGQGIKSKVNLQVVVEPLNVLGASNSVYIYDPLLHPQLAGFSGGTNGTASLAGDAYLNVSDMMWNMNVSDDVIAHEAGHLLGLRGDQYYWDRQLMRTVPDPLYAGTLMADQNGNTTTPNKKDGFSNIDEVVWEFIGDNNECWKRGPAPTQPPEPNFGSPMPQRLPRLGGVAN